MFNIRQANESDVDQIRDIYHATYGEHYAYPQYYDATQLRKLVYSEDTVLLVAEDAKSGRIAGTASVIFEVGTNADLVAEFGRLAVHPDFRRKGIGKLLMRHRIDHAKHRLHVGLVEPRLAHAHSQQIASTHGFAAVGFQPMKLLLRNRESVGLFIQHFGEALELRKNNPRVAPEVHTIADIALGNCGLRTDVIIDDRSAPYPHNRGFQLDELKTEAYTALLRFEHGRIRHREIFGPLRLHYGLFKLKARHSQYLLAKRDGQIEGAVGFTSDEVEKTVRIFELISLDARPIRFLLESLVKKCQEQWGVEYIDVDVSADAPRMQRTLLELDFLPVAYAPAFVFHEVERLDTVRMARLLVPPDFDDVDLTEPIEPFATEVIRRFTRRKAVPKVARAIPRVALFTGMNGEQAEKLASGCSVRSYQANEYVMFENDKDGRLRIVLEGVVDITQGKSNKFLGTIGPGECLGEMGLLTGTPHSTTAIAQNAVEVAMLTYPDFNELVRRRPDIGVVVYRNLATGIGEKLRKADERLTERVEY